MSADTIPVEGVAEHARAEALLAARGRPPGTYTADEYVEAVAEVERMPAAGAAAESEVLLRARRILGAKFGRDGQFTGLDVAEAYVAARAELGLPPVEAVVAAQAAEYTDGKVTVDAEGLKLHNAAVEILTAAGKTSYTDGEYADALVTAERKLAGGRAS